MEQTIPETKVPTPVVIHDVPEPVEFLGSEPLYTVTEEGQEFKLERFEELFRDIIHRAGSRRGVLDEQALWKAFYFAYEQHIDQIRKDGSPYFTHLIGTARIITDLTDDPVSIQSALLHDIVEDPKVPIQVIREKFGEQVAVIVDGVTKISEISFGNMAEKQAANLRKMILAMAQDPRVILVKLSDRLHNMSTIDWLVEKRQKEIARETLDIYAPLAHRLGIWWMKWRLEDLCLKVLDPDSYREIKNQVGSKREQRDGLLQQATSKILEELRKHGISAVVQGRAKHFYSIHKKMMSQGRSFDDILDLLAIRIIVTQNDECYAALGHVHALYTPLPDYFADYIASPKSNGYRSIHTKVIGPKGHTLEVQIRTKEMHEQAELGLAAHWRYKENEGWDLVDAELSRWMRNMIEAQQDATDYQEFLQVLKSDLQPKDIYVISPRGDVYRLPKDATAIDFAFLIHSDVGLHAIAAKVNGRIAPLSATLPYGCTIEIITSAKGKPSAEWLTAVKTPKARTHIKRYYQEVRFEECQKLGEEILHRETQRINLKLKTDEIQTVANQLGFGDLGSFHAAIGYGQLKMSHVLRKLVPQQPSSANWLTKIIRKSKPKQSDTGVKVTGLDHVMISLGRCCTPLPGDRIRGYLTKGKGIVVHRMNCKNLSELSKEPDKIVDVSWDVDPEAVFNVRLQIVANDRKGMLHDVTTKISSFDVNILSLQMQANDGTAVGSLVLSVKSLSQLSQIISKVSSVKDVIRIHRLDETDVENAQ